MYQTTAQTSTYDHDPASDFKASSKQPPKMTNSKTKSSNLKHSYTIPCSSEFRDQVVELADKRKVNVADLARSVLLMVSRDDIDNFTDPGEPGSEDRETVILKSGPSKGRPWRRKPRLQVRMAPGYDPLTIRKALNLALCMESGIAHVRIQTQADLKAQAQEKEALKKRVVELTALQEEKSKQPETSDDLERLQAMVSALSFEPLRHGVQDRSDALHILGFEPKAYPDRSELRSRFRMLATIYHPDGQYGSHERMSQLNQAMQILR